MPKRYSEMTPYELREEIGVLKEQAIKAEQLGIVNEFDVLMRKIAMARAYMTDINKFHIGETYELVEEPGILFEITYFNGVFAWGHKQNDNERDWNTDFFIARKIKTRGEYLSGFHLW